MVDPDGGSGSWRWILMVDHDRGGCWPWTMITTRLLDIQYVYTDTRPLLTIIHHPLTFHYATVFILFIAANTHIFLMFSFTRGISCTSVRPGRGIPHMWLSLRFLLSFYPVKRVLSCSFSLLLLRAKGRGCHTLLKPYETNCDLWIWAIQIRFDWLIHLPITS